MKAKNGGIGMTDEQVEKLAERNYVPTKVETASCLLSSFFFGVFTALVVVSGQQRDYTVSFT